MLEGKAMVKETDMGEKMQRKAMACASQALDLFDISDCISIAAHIKKVIPNPLQGSFCSLLWVFFNLPVLMGFEVWFN